jgi:hypothetical protein
MRQMSGAELAAYGASGKPSRSYRYEAALSIRIVVPAERMDYRVLPYDDV